MCRKNKSVKKNLYWISNQNLKNVATPTNLAFSTLSIESHLIPKNYVYWNIVVYSASIKEQIYKRRLRMPMNNISKWFTLGPISRLKNSSYTSCYALNLCWLILIIILFGYAQAVLFLQLNSVPLSELYVWMAKIHPVLKID